MSVQHANRGVVKKDLQLYYNREFAKSFRGEATINIAYSTNNYLNSNSNWWVNSGTNIFNDNDTSIEKPVILNVDTTDLRIFSSTVVTVGSQQLGSSIIPILPSTQYSMSIYYWFRGSSMGVQPYLRTNVNNNSLGNFAYNGDTNYLNWPRSTWIRLTVTFTTQANETGVYMSSYTGDNVGEKLAYFGYQLEQKAYATPLVLGSRSVSTTNLLTATYSSLPTNWVVDGSGQATIGTYSYIENNSAIRIVDVNSNTRLYVDQLAVVSASTTYTFSVKYRKVSGTPTLRFQIAWYNSSNAFVGSVSFPTTPQINIYDINGWQLAWYTVTSPASTAKVLWFIQDGNDYTTYNHTYDLKEPQIQTGIYPTNWVATSWTANTIASNGGLKDISGNNVNADLTNVLFNSSGYYFNGTSTSIDTGYSILNIDPSQSFSIEAIVNFDALTSYSPSTFTISNVNTTTNVITTSVTHNLVAGDRISFNVSGGSLPSPLLDGSNIAPYYIISPTTNTFKVSTSSGGTEIDITTAGSGTITASVPNRSGMLFGRASYGGIGIYYGISPTNVVTIFGYLRTTAGYYNTAGAVISTGVTYLITVVFDELNGRIYSLYLNGVFQGSAYCPSSATYSNGAVGNFSIGEGGQADGGGTLIYNPFKGSCPMQRIYRRALTAAEVLQNFNATRKAYGI